ncbi:MAG: cation:proton antiporter [Phormidesmis sp.]
MLESIVYILLLGFFSGQLVKRLGCPPLLGMVVAGMVMGPQVANVLDAGVLGAADGLRSIAVMVILMKAGLGLDREKLAQQGTVALRLGLLPGLCEAIAIAAFSVWLLEFDVLTGLLLGCIIGAESPAVIVPGMLRLKRLGWGADKGIADAILTGSALSDVWLLMLFSLLLSLLVQAPTGGWSGGLSINAVRLLPVQVIMQVVLGVAVGWLSGRLLVRLLAARQWTQNSVQDGIVAAGAALLLVVLAERLPVFSGYLAVMSTGFFLIELDAPLARRLRSAFNGLWVVAEIVLFVLLGASIQFGVLQEILGVGLVLLLVGLLVGRSLGWFLSTLGSNWTLPERLFLLPGNSAKATVQAAIGAVPLALGIPGGEAILAISALSILVTAPLGAWAIPTFAPKLLKQGKVDPTKVRVVRRTLLFAAIDGSPFSAEVLTKTAELARSADAEVIVFYVMEGNTKIEPIRLLAKQRLADIRYQFVIGKGDAATEIVQNALTLNATEIVMGKRGESGLPSASGLRTVDGSLVGSVTKVVVSRSPFPVTVVAAGSCDD